MEYFLSHVKYILMAGVFIAVVSSVWALAAIKWQKNKSKKNPDSSPSRWNPNKSHYPINSEHH